jgi:hypothetical protein
MPEWSDEQRERVAAQFRKVGGGWHGAMDLMDACGPLWFECLRCHRLRTIAVAGADEASHAVRALEHYADYEDWFHQAG